MSLPDIIPWSGPLMQPLFVPWMMHLLALEHGQLYNLQGHCKRKMWAPCLKNGRKVSLKVLKYKSFSFLPQSLLMSWCFFVVVAI